MCLPTIYITGRLLAKSRLNFGGVRSFCRFSTEQGVSAPNLYIVKGRRNQWRKIDLIDFGAREEE